MVAKVFLLAFLAALCSVATSQEWNCGRNGINTCDASFGTCENDGTCTCAASGLRTGYDCGVWTNNNAPTGCGCTFCRTATQCSCEPNQQGPQCEYAAHNVNCDGGVLTFSTTAPEAALWPLVRVVGNDTNLVYGDGNDANFPTGFNGYRGTVDYPVDATLGDIENATTGQSCIEVVYRAMPPFFSSLDFRVPFCCGGSTTVTMEPQALPIEPVTSGDDDNTAVAPVTEEVTAGGVVMKLLGVGGVEFSAPPNVGDVLEIHIYLNESDPNTTAAGIFVTECVVVHPDDGDVYVNFVLGGCSNNTFLYQGATYTDESYGPLVTIWSQVILFDDGSSPEYVCTTTVCSNADSPLCAAVTCDDGMEGYGRRKRQAETPKSDATGTSQQETLRTYLRVRNPFQNYPTTDGTGSKMCPEQEVAAAVATASLTGTVIALGATIVVLLFIIALLACFLFNKSRRVDHLKA